MAKTETDKGEKKQETTELIPFLRNKGLNIHQRINKIMDEVNYVKKDKEIKNAKGEAMYSVTGHDAVTKLIHPLLVKHGIIIIPSFENMEHEVLEVEKYQKTTQIHRTRIDATFKWVNIDKPEDLFEQNWSGYGCDSTDKGPGMAISYIMRYIILKTLLLETGERDLEDNQIDFEKGRLIPHSKEVQGSIAGEGGDIPLGDAPIGRISKGAVTALERLFDKHKQDKKFILDQFMVDTVEEILIKDYNAVKDLITG